MVINLELLGVIARDGPVQCDKVSSWVSVSHPRFSKVRHVFKIYQIIKLKLKFNSKFK